MWTAPNVAGLPSQFGAPMGGYDMRRNLSVAWDAAGQYSTDLFTSEAVRLVREHPQDADAPLFLYLAHLAPHTGNRDDPFQALDQDIAHFSYIADPERRVYAGEQSEQSRASAPGGRVTTPVESVASSDIDYRFDIVSITCRLYPFLSEIFFFQIPHVFCFAC